MATKQEFLQCFQMPSGYTITGRASTIRNVFVAAIVPKALPTADEIAEVLGILDMEPSDLRCSYCGDVATEWDHLRPLVTGSKPTGYPSSIRNLVPACGKCNQSKGKSDWKTWMMSTAKLSPMTRGVSDLSARVQRLEAYEAWAACRPLDIQALADKEMLDEYYQLQSDILTEMREAQQLASQLAAQIQERSTNDSDVQ